MVNATHGGGGIYLWPRILACAAFGDANAHRCDWAVGGPSRAPHRCTVTVVDDYVPRGRA